MTPSKYQVAIYDWVKNGNGSAVIEAIAGSGKTTVLKEVANIIPDDKRVLMIAFNKSIVEELRNKIQSQNVKIMTLNAFGFYMLKTHFKYQDFTPKLDVDQYKYKNHVKKNFLELTEGVEFSDKTEIEEFKQTLLSLIDMCRLYLCETNVDIETISEKYNYIVSGDHVRIVKNVINWGKNNLETIDFIDQISLPYYLNININSFKYDWVLIDEAQDTSIAAQKLFQKCIKKDGRFIAVGDSAQSIQSFAGADIEAFQKLKSLPNTISLPLSINYRCPNFVEGLVKQFVENFEVFNKKRAGIFKENVLVKDIKDNSMVICRKTQPLIELYLRLIKDNRKCYIKGLDIGSNIIEIIERLDTPYICNDFQCDGVIPKLYKQLFEYRKTIIKKYKIDLYDATSENSVQQKLEVINTIKALSEGINNTYQLIDRCKKIFKQSNSDGICLITNHKAKGLENDVVYHLCPSLLPDKRATKDWEIETERNLEYVLYTRTKNEFYTISEEDFPPPQGSRDIKELVSYLSVIEQMVNRLYSGTTEQVQEIRSDNSKKIDVPKPLKKKPVSKKEKTIVESVKENPMVKKLERIMIGKTINECYEIFNDFGIPFTIRVVFHDVKTGMKNVIEDGNDDTVNVEISDMFDCVVKRIISIGKDFQ